MSLVALLLTWLFGLGLWLWLAGRPRDLFGVCAALGAGYLLGAVGWGALLGLFARADATALFATLAPWLGGVALLLSASAWRWAPTLAAPAMARASLRERWLIAATLLLLLLVFIALVQQATALPSLSWDAWNAWLAKSKAWYFTGHMTQAVSYEAWLAATPGSVITTTAPFYPEALPRFALWLASAAGGWDESAVHLAWPLAWLALGLACFGYLGLAGCRAVHAMLTAAALLLLPLVTAHAALAGYADLWLAALLMLAGLHFAAWFRARARRDAIAAAVFALLGIAVKLEGAVWLACLAGATLLVLLPRRWRWALLLAGPLLWAAALPFGGLRLPLPGLGVVRFAWGLIDIPTRGTMTLSWRPVLDEFVQALFLLPNWSLLWYVAPLVLILSWRALAQRRELAALGAFLALGYAFLFVLFFLTDAAAWAENFTSVNRVLLQVVPVTVAWLSLLWAARAASGRSRSSAA